MYCFKNLIFSLFVRFRVAISCFSKFKFLLNKDADKPLNTCFCIFFRPIHEYMKFSPSYNICLSYALGPEESYYSLAHNCRLNNVL